ncbi:hypothetical protein HK103_002547 [Boothiomyces macroporosus]|uniref:L-type lectin-like domain-containing protein n=1 Tax=Boothiomyces macroporosus TaxID=261099 RepID=A0AAD5UCV0_9FUNG|nr:hypothetical protein HK103_002547 [Boothiomyces macroporosus]
MLLPFIIASVASEAVFGVSTVPTRFDYKQTFKYPYYTLHPNINYFNKSGDVMFTTEVVRIVPSLSHKMGAMWCETPNPHKEWMVEFSFSVYGRGTAGGDGFVFWYTKDKKPPVIYPDFYGHSAKFHGLAIVFDTSDVAKNRYLILTRFNPFIYALENKGHMDKADFQNYQSPDVNIGSCFRDYRNSPVPAWAKVTYLKGLELDVRQGGKGYTKCFETNIHLPTDASSGSRAPDDHDIHSFETYELNPEKREHKMRPHEQEDIAAGHEFKMQKEYEQKIKKIEEEVEKAQKIAELHEEFGINPQSVQQIEENQFHILEALNLIQDKLEIPHDSITPEHQNSFEQRITDKVEMLHGKIQLMQRDLALIHESTKRLTQQSESLLNSLHIKVEDAKTLLKEGKESGSTLGRALMFFASLAGLGVLIIGYSFYARGKDAGQKKFV